ncbi:serine/threonine-protein kinase 31 [Zonotrichia albicollis]|uniref:serine/threonine-protein kinase 31 n=1 Tax=Zonotrichia albicollis TaxID=44394 RepID=UPI003D8105D8
MQELTASLEMMYGQDSEADDSGDFQQFFEWMGVKTKKLICVRNNMDTTLQILADWFSDISKDSVYLERLSAAPSPFLQTSSLNLLLVTITLQEHDEAQKRIIMSTHNKAIYEAQYEQSVTTE